MMYVLNRADPLLIIDMEICEDPVKNELILTVIIYINATADAISFNVTDVSGKSGKRSQKLPGHL